MRTGYIRHLSFILHRLVLAVTFITTFGEGLALRGPVGSMVKAIEGMIDEQNQVVKGFNQAVRIYIADTYPVCHISSS